MELEIISGGRFGKVNTDLKRDAQGPYYWRGAVGPKRSGRGDSRSSESFKGEIAVDYVLKDNNEKRVLWWEPVIAFSIENSGSSPYERNYGSFGSAGAEITLTKEVEWLSPPSR